MKFKLFATTMIVLLLLNTDSSELHKCNVVTNMQLTNMNKEGIVIASDSSLFKGKSSVKKSTKKLIKKGVWTELAGMSTARIYPGIVSCNEKLYALGGSIARDSETNTIEEYNTKKDSWILKKSLLEEKKTGFGTVVLNNKIYIFGGKSNGVLVNTVEEYDPIKDEITQKADMPTARQLLGVTAVDGLIYTIGGDSLHQKMDGGVKVEVYDPKKDTWTSKADMTETKLHVEAVTIGDKIYVICEGKVEEYDPVKDSWKVKTSLPINKTDLAIAVISNKIYIMGGWSNNNIVNTVNIYDVKKDKWKTLDPLPNSIGFAGAAVINGKIYLAGGVNASWGQRKNLLVYIP